jgi:hypothetical protein
MLDPQIVVNLFPELGVGADLVGHRMGLLKDFKCAAERFLQSLGRMVDYSKRPHAPARSKTAVSPLCVRVGFDFVMT